MRLRSPASRLAALTVATCSWASPCIAQQPKFEVVAPTERTVLAARIIDVRDGRWAVVESRKHVWNSNSGRRQLQVFSHDLSSVDCRNRGFERVKRAFNVETDPTKAPKWVVQEFDGYDQGVNPTKITHQPVANVLAREYQEIVSRSDEKSRVTLPSPGTGKVRDDEEVLVDFACAVARGSTPSEAALLMNNTLGLAGVVPLVCTFSREGDDLELIVRFHEETGYVKLGNEWRFSRIVSRERIVVKDADSELSISRLTGRARLDMGEGAVVAGSCDQLRETRKF